jgi:hypothetical protein
MKDNQGRQMTERNPYQTGTPEWLLWENMVSNERLSNTFAEDAIRYTSKSQSARELSEAFKVALAAISSGHHEQTK